MAAVEEFVRGMAKPVAATVVVAVAVALSYVQRLGLEGEMLYAIFRAFLQLSVIGFVLQFIFSNNNAIWILLAYLFMVWFPLYITILFLFLFLYVYITYICIYMSMRLCFSFFVSLLWVGKFLFCFRFFGLKVVFFPFFLFFFF